jgi:D-alanyl-lipoteichoic acid acyltransferase DltB (MBOAT superfamily)
VTFNSVTFVVYLAIMLALYWLLPRRPRLWLLFLGSLVFYGFWRVEYIVLMLIPTVIDYFAALAIDASRSRARRRLILVLSLGSNVALLVYFKYLLFFATAGAGLLDWLGFDVPPPRFSIVLPLGISFYTFETMSYVIDVYRRFIRPERDFVVYGCFVTFFPQLVAGPILRAAEKIPKLSQRPPFRLSDFTIGLRRVLFGLFLKVVLADNLAARVDTGFSIPVEALTALDVWTLAFLFGFQIYFDFSGYSHVALGCARMMGIQFPENFAFPYLSASPREFWRRWHISLSSWIRDYLYLPLAREPVQDRSVGGLATAASAPPSSARVERRRNLALFESWAIMGLWHGANWTFLLWGVYHALLVYAFRKLTPRFHWLARVSREGNPLGVLLTLPLVMLGWIPFRARTLGDAVAMLGKVLDPRQYLSLGLSETTYLVTALSLALVVAAYTVREHLLPALDRWPAASFAVHTLGYALAIALVFVFLRPIQQFIYFQF